MHEQRIAVIAPGAAQVDFVGTLGTGDAALVEDVAIGNVLRRRGGGDVGVDLAEDVTVLKPRRRRTEDEVGSSLDVAVLEVEACLGITSIDGVLVAEEATVDERQSVALGMQRHSLSQSGGIVLDGEVLQRDARPLNA